MDFIVSHCCASSTERLIGGGIYYGNYLNDYFEKIGQSVTFKKWFFGHYHIDGDVSTKEMVMYEQIIRIV